MGADGKRSRALSAGYLDRGERSILRRPASRNVLTKEWLVSMKQKGIIISDAEMRYRKWLALSDSQKPSMSIPTRSRRPATAPSLSAVHHTLGQFRENKCSKLRQRCLPDPTLPEINHSRIVQQKRLFEKQCRSYSPVTIQTGNFPREGESPHQFLVGSRYNSSHVIDSRSLSRLGVYIPRSNLRGTFINPAGIQPPQSTQCQYGRVGSVMSPRVPQSLLAEVQTLMEADSQSIDNSSMSLSCCSSQSIKLKEDDTESITAQQSPPHSPMPLQSSGVIEPFDRQLMVSAEAASLANEILEESIVNSEHSLIKNKVVTNEVTDDKQDDERNLDVMDSTRNTSPVSDVLAKCRSHPEILHSSVVATRDTDTRSSSTTLIVDMTQLQINS